MTFRNIAPRKSADSCTVLRAIDEEHERYKRWRTALRRVTVPSQGEYDPFKSFPIAWRRDLNEDFYYLTKSFGPALYGYPSNNEHFDVFETQIQLALTDATAFHSLMTISTMRKDAESGKTLPGLSFLYHRAQAIRLVTNRLEQGKLSDCTSQGFIYAIMVLMSISRTWGAIDVDIINAEALNHLVVLKGGIKFISKDHPVLETALFGTAILNSGIIRSGLYDISGTEQLPQEDPRGLLYNALSFLRATTNIYRRRPEALAKIHNFFAPGTVAFNLMVEQHAIPGMANERVVRIMSRCIGQLAAYICSVLIYGCDNQLQRFLQHLDFVEKRSHIWKNSLRLLVWAVLCDVKSGSLMFSALAWQAYQICCIGPYISMPIAMSGILGYMSFLTGDPSGPARIEDVCEEIRAIMFQLP